MTKKLKKEVIHVVIRNCSQNKTLFKSFLELENHQISKYYYTNQNQERTGRKLTAALDAIIT